MKNLHFVARFSWFPQDSVRNETVPFGNNRTIATMRRQWMDRNNLCDDRDLILHKEEVDKKRIIVAAHFSGNGKDPASDLAGEQCWLQFVAFDVRLLLCWEHFTALCPTLTVKIHKTDLVLGR